MPPYAPGANVRPSNNETRTSTSTSKGHPGVALPTMFTGSRATERADVEFYL